MKFNQDEFGELMGSHKYSEAKQFMVNIIENFEIASEIDKSTYVHFLCLLFVTELAKRVDEPDKLIGEFYGYCYKIREFLDRPFYIGKHRVFIRTLLSRNTLSLGQEQSLRSIFYESFCDLVIEHKRDFIKILLEHNIQNLDCSNAPQQFSCKELTSEKVVTRTKYFLCICNLNEKEFNEEAIKSQITNFLSEKFVKETKFIGIVFKGLETVSSSILDKFIKTWLIGIENLFLENYSSKNPNFLIGTESDYINGFFYNHLNQWVKYSDNEILNFHLQKRQEFDAFIKEVGTINHNFKTILHKLQPAISEDTVILLLGDTGVGKTHLARIIHNFSHRSEKPFINHNCVQLDSDKIYQTLFGWKKGSHSGASKDGKGLLEEAEGGTLFLDEIGYTDTATQKSLLTFLDNKTYRKLGDPVEKTANVRLIFGTNQDLISLISKELFLPDLYERIAGKICQLPPIKDRQEDIIELTRRFLNQMNDLNKGNESYVEIGICIDAVKLLQNCSWPGNVRQLKSYIENLYNYCKYHKNSLITVEMIKTDPPREKASFVDNKLSQMEIILTHFLKNWKVEKGKFLDDFLSPIVAKLCVDNLKDIVNTRNASELIGLDWSRGKNSTMIKSYKKYDSIKT